MNGTLDSPWLKLHRHFVSDLGDFPTAHFLTIPIIMKEASEKFQVIPPCGGILILREAPGACRWFQVIPPCGGIHYACGEYGENTLSFKSYPLAGVFVLSSARRRHAEGFKSYPLAGVFRLCEKIFHNFFCFKSYPLAGVFPSLLRQAFGTTTVSSHTPLRGYSKLYAYYSRLRMELSRNVQSGNPLNLKQSVCAA